MGGPGRRGGGLGGLVVVEAEKVTTVMEVKDRYAERFAELAEGAGASGADWFMPIRREALASFARLGFPT